MPAISQQSEWLDALPADTLFWLDEIPGPSRGAVHAFLHREVAKPDPARRAWRIIPSLYWKPDGLADFNGMLLGPDIENVGSKIAGPNAGGFGWYGANLVGWSTQMPLGVDFAVPGEPRSRHPYPRVELRGRRNLRRSELTGLEATYFEAVIGFDQWAEFEWWFEDRWEAALDAARYLLRYRKEEGYALPRTDVMRFAAEAERPITGTHLFRERIESLLDAFDNVEFVATAA